MKWLHFGSGIALGFLLGFFVPHNVTAPVIDATLPLATTSQAAAVVMSDTGDWYPVVKVVDGDTIVVAKNGKSMTVRLIGVDTPETVDPRKPVQCFGKAASDETKKML